MTPASAATPPTITVSVVNRNAATLKVTGSHFARSANVVLQFEQDGVGSDDDVQTFTIRSNRRGNFSVTETAYVTASCVVGVFAQQGTQTSNVVNLNTTGMGCPGAQLQVDPCNPVCSDFTVTGSGFTPGSGVEVDFTDAATGDFILSDEATICGTLVPGPYPPAPAGQIGLTSTTCTGFEQHLDAFCHRNGDLIQVSAVDLDTDFVVPGVLVDPRC